MTIIFIKKIQKKKNCKKNFIITATKGSWKNLISLRTTSTECQKYDYGQNVILKKFLIFSVLMFYRNMYEQKNGKRENYRKNCNGKFKLNET